MKKQSIWYEHVSLPEFPKLEKNLSTDIVVIGGGLAGILTSYYLTKEGFHVILLEKDRIGRGKTGNSTGVISLEHDVLYQDLVKEEGFSAAKSYLKENLSAIKAYQELARQYDFDLEERPLYLYATEKDEIIKKEVKVLNDLGISAKEVDKIELPFPVKKAAYIPGQFQMNPLKLIAALAPKLEIYEHSMVTRWKGHQVFVGPYRVSAKKIIVATHFPFINRVGLYFAKMYQKRSFVVALNTHRNLKGSYLNIEEKNFYFRDYKGYLIIGGNDRKTGTCGPTFQNLIDYGKKHEPNAKLEYLWANQDCVTLDQIPYIGIYSRLFPDVFVITGMNLWGMTQSMIAAHLMKDILLGKKKSKESIYSPHRGMISLQLFKNLGNFIRHLFTFHSKRCSHMGCALRWNETEKSWDCPCHGSRFSIEKEVIDNPAMRKIK